MKHTPALSKEMNNKSFRRQHENGFSQQLP
jgi:hypothetical protein